MKVDKSLEKYINDNILPLYDNNFIGDGRDRVDYVLGRCKEIIKENDLEVDVNILYTVVSYHDLRKNNDEKNHEVDSADIMYNDEFLKSFFSEEDRVIIRDAIIDQRSNMNEEVRNIYGKLLSSASRNSSIEQCFLRSYEYGKKKNPSYNEDEIFEGCYDALNKKFGNNGYAKFYFKDSKYEKFLLDIRKLLDNKEEFISKHKEYILNHK